jgi:hypothetical protein
MRKGLASVRHEAVEKIKFLWRQMNDVIGFLYQPTLCLTRGLRATFFVGGTSSLDRGSYE